jgi:hypothetical protein
MFSAPKNRCTDKAVYAGGPPHVHVLRTRCHVPYERPNLPAFSVKMFRRSSLMILRTFCTFSSVRPVEGRLERSESLTEVSQILNRENHSKICIIPIALSPKAVFEHFMRF